MNETTILVIEDDKSIQNFMKISLKTRGYAYILADNGLSGISLFYADHPDLILLDLGLPGYLQEQESASEDFVPVFCKDESFV